MISLDAIRAASRAIDPAFRDTPQYAPEALGAALGCALTVKVETANPIRSFKGRGTDWFVHSLGADRTPLVCASAGNFGQGLAWACRSREIPLTVFASRHANPLKVARMQALGATVRQEGEDFDAAKEAAAAYAAETGARYVEDGRVPEIAEGAGTIALELLRDAAPFDAVVVPLGNGALLGGMAAWIRNAAPGTEIIGVVAASAPSMKWSWERGVAVPTERADTIADGIAVRVPIPEAVETLRGPVDDVVAVEDAQILDAMRLLVWETGLIVEPAGAAGVAALLADPTRYAGRRVATVLCGSNVTAEQARAWSLLEKPLRPSA